MILFLNQLVVLTMPLHHLITRVIFNFSKEYFSKILDFEFDRLNNLIFDPDLIANEKKIILERKTFTKRK